MSTRAPTLGAPSLRHSFHYFLRPRPVLHGVWPAPIVSAIALATLGACGGPAADDTPVSASVAQSFSRGHAGQLLRGESLFDEAFADTNGRSCSTCHVLDEHTVLTPANVSARLAADPSDPLFNRIDADDEFVDHHVMMFARHPHAGLNHVSFEVQDIDDLAIGHD